MLNLKKSGYDRTTVGRWMYTGRPEMPGAAVESARKEIADRKHKVLPKPRRR